MIFIFAEIDKYQLITKETKREIEIRVKNKLDIEILNKEIGSLRKRFPTYKFFITLYDNFQIDNLNLNKLDKFKNHINQNLKLLVKVKICDERKTKNNKYMYTITCELPGQRKYIKCKTFNDAPLIIKIGSYYIVNGVLTIGDEKYIKKNEKALGKNNDYYLNIKSIEEYDFKENEIKELQKVSRAELHAHTCFSKNDAFITVKNIEEAFDSNKLHTMSITDHGAVFAFIPYVNALKNKYKNTDKKLILGSEFYAVDYKKYQTELNMQLIKLEEEKDNIKNNNEHGKEIENLQLFVTELREKRKEYKKIMNRKTVSAEEKEIATNNYNLTTQDIDETLTKIKELKTFCKDFEERIIQIDKEIEYIKNQFDTVHDCDRDHLTVLLKTPDTTINYRGEEITINLGLVELYKLISESYINYFSAPVDKEKKKFGKRPTLPYHLIFGSEIRKNFVITSACAFGKHMKLAIENKWEEFRNWIHNLDAVEIQPSWNNSYMVTHEDYPNITKIEDVYNLHRNIYQVCKEENVPCIITSDAHVGNKEDRIFRSRFKEGYVNLIKSYVKDNQNNAAGDDDFSIEKQPFIMSVDDVMEDYQKQGFSIAEIEEMHNNSNNLAEQCVNAFDITILPNKLFLPDFPDIDAKLEVPKIVWENAIKKWSKDGTKETIHPQIKERIEKELEAIASTGFEVLYMIAQWCCLKSMELGYIVGSRGSAGSMITTYLMEIGENNPLPPHYYCKECHHVEFVETHLVGLDLEDKSCPKCGCFMSGDGLDIESENFLGWKNIKIPDIDLNFSENVQSIIHEELIKMFGQENAIKSGTQGFYQQDSLLKDIFSHIPNIQSEVQNETFDIDYMANETQTLRTTGAHPGGILLKPNDIPFEYITPLVFVADNPKKGELSSFIDYHNIESNLVKIDALGHSDPTMLKELHESTGKDFRDIKFNDKMLYEVILNPELLGIDKEQYPFPATTAAISEMNTDFTMQMLAELKPQTMTDLIYFSGLSHGTGVWNGNIQRELILSGERKLNEVIPVRDIIFQQLTKKYNFEPSEAFAISESVRKGKGIKKWEKELKEKCPYWYVEIMKGITYLFPKAF